MDAENIVAAREVVYRVGGKAGVIGQCLGGAETGAADAYILSPHVVEALAEVLLVDPCLVKPPCGMKTLALTVGRK